MSAERNPSEDERQTCTPCRGTGRVISNLGGEQREIACPWCEGSGEFQPGHDAQGGAASPPESPAGGAEAGASGQ
jgi:DnaJ-class molecular chaperone